MANRIIPELDEIAIEDLTTDQLMILDSGLQTFKLRLDTLASFLLTNGRAVVTVEFDGMTTGETTVDVSAYVFDARVIVWMLKKPQSGTDGEQMPATVIKTPDDTTVVIDSGDFALDAGTYTLIGV